MRVYISGPITGKPDYNRAAFDAAKQRLLAPGRFVINPHDLAATIAPVENLARSFEALYSGNYNPKERMVRLANAVVDAELAAVRSCDTIYLLRGWENSRGAKMELAEALKHGLKIALEDAECKISRAEMEAGK